MFIILILTAGIPSRTFLGRGQNGERNRIKSKSKLKMLREEVQRADLGHLRHLIEGGCDVNAEFEIIHSPTCWGGKWCTCLRPTLLTEAILNQWTDGVRLLLTLGADVEKSGSTVSKWNLCRSETRCRIYSLRCETHTPPTLAHPGNTCQPCCAKFLFGSTKRLWAGQPFCASTHPCDHLCTHMAGRLDVLNLSPPHHPEIVH